MIRVNVLVEGQTEETFVRDVLGPYFQNVSIFLTPILAQTSTGHKGGIVSYGKVRHQLVKLCKADASSFVTTFIDFYKYPNDAPGKKDDHYRALRNSYDKVLYLQNKLVADIAHGHFIPFLMLHEFEALLFCQPEKISEWLDDVPQDQLCQIAQSFQSPEEINEGEQTAPSKRLAHLVPRYRKALHGPIIAEDIGIDLMRERCSHFRNWLDNLLALALR